MTESEPTTDRARRQRAVERGATDTAVDRMSDRMTPRVQQAKTTSRTAQRESKQGVAEELDIDPSGVGSRSEIGGGVDVFLRSTGAEQFGARVRQQFAGEASFVEPADVTPNVNAREISASPQLASDRRDECADADRPGTGDRDAVAGFEIRSLESVDSQPQEFEKDTRLGTERTDRVDRIPRNDRVLRERTLQIRVEADNPPVGTDRERAVPTEPAMSATEDRFHCDPRSRRDGLDGLPGRIDRAGRLAAAPSG